MPVFRWGHPWIEFQDLEREVDRLLQSVNITFNTLRFGRQYPPLNLYEVDDKYLITAELPGVKPDDLELTIANTELLSRLEGLANLKYIQLFRTDISDESMSVLARFPALEQIRCGQTRIGDDGLARLSGMRPRLRCSIVCTWVLMKPGASSVPDASRI